MHRWALKTLSRSVTLAAAMLGLGGCFPDSQVCEPGETQQCFCPTTVSTQMCAEDGESWEDCGCGISASCGDGVCGAGESCATCPLDCGLCSGPSGCQGNPEQIGTQELAQSDIDRDACEFAQPNELSYCQQQDGPLLSIPTTDAFLPAIEIFKTKASIAAHVPVYPVTDLQSFVAVGGGMTGHSRVLVDAKLFEILYEVAMFRAMQMAGETGDDEILAIDQIVSYHNSFPGQTANLFKYDSDVPSTLQSAGSMFESMAGALTYHEFGHYWAYACIDQLRAQYATGGQLNFWPSKIEDDADMIAGVLTAKAGYDPQWATQMFDLMAFYIMQRQGFAVTFAQVESDYVQYMSSSPKYSTLATRKQILLYGYNLWFQYGP